MDWTESDAGGARGQPGTRREGGEEGKGRTLEFEGEGVEGAWADVEDGRHSRVALGGPLEQEHDKENKADEAEPRRERHRSPAFSPKWVH